MVEAFMEMQEEVETSSASFYGKFDYPLSIKLSPLAVLVFKREEDTSDTRS
jgi:hypothetical protein